MKKDEENRVGSTEKWKIWPKKHLYPCILYRISHQSSGNRYSLILFIHFEGTI